MNKNLMVKAIIEKLGTTQREVEQFISAYENLIVETVSKDEDVKTSLGTFKKQATKGRSGVSKLGGEEIEWKTEDSFKPVLKPSKLFKESVK